MGIFLALTLIAGLAERMIPLDFMIPGVKLGLSNAVVLLALYRFSYPKLLFLVIAKCLILSLLGGGTVSFFYSLAGSMLSLSAMSLLVKTAGRHIGPVGISVAGSLCHSIGQLAVARILLGDLFARFYLPVMAGLSSAAGAIVGALVKCALPHLRFSRIGGSCRPFLFRGIQRAAAAQRSPAPPRKPQSDKLSPRSDKNCAGIIDG
jgi:heptaprenyl diphosphate synthase